MTGENSPIDQQANQAPMAPEAGVLSPKSAREDTDLLEAGLEESGSQIQDAQLAPQEPKAPAQPAFDEPPDTFFDLNYSKGTLKEFTWSHSPLLIPFTATIGLFVKALGIKLAGSTDDPPIQAWAPFEAADIPEDSRHLFIPVGADLAREGFATPVYHVLQDPLHDTTYAAATLQHPSGRAIARVLERKWFFQAKPKDYFHTQFITQFVDGTWLITDNAKPDALAPGTVDVQHLTGLAIAPLWAKHQERLAQAGKPVKPIFTQDDTRLAIDALHAQLRDFHLARGFFTPLGQLEKEHLRLAWHSHQAMPTDSYYTRCVYAQTNRNTLAKKQTWAQVILTLLTTGALFVGSFKLYGNAWSLIGLIVVILIIHELGHFIAMKAFGYKNVRMFFIPLFGAAVTGLPEKVASWKQVIVFLAGPLPGIALAIPVGIAGYILKSDVLLDFALFLLIINGFNLIPILPFDGGHVVHKTLFVRHPVFEAVFRIAAAGCLLLLGILISIAGKGAATHIITMMAIWMCFAIPMAIKTAWFVHNTRDSLPTEEPGIPLPVGPTVGRAIFNHLAPTGALQAGAQTKAQAAALATPIVESLRNRPPHIVASLAFVIVQFGAIGLALLLLILVVVARRHPAGNLASSFGSPTVALGPKLLPPIDISNNPLQVSVQPGYAPGAPSPHSLIAASFPDELKARTCYEGLEINMTEKSGRLLVGNLVIVSLPRADKSTYPAFAGLIKSQTQFTLELDDPQWLSYTFKIQAPSSAQAAELSNTISEFLKLPAQTSKLIPPWQPNDSRTAQEQADHALARKTITRIESVFSALQDSDPEIKKTMQQLASPDFGRVPGGTDSFFEQMTKRTTQLRKDAANQVKNEPGMDTLLPDLYLEDYAQLSQRRISGPRMLVDDAQSMPRSLKRMGTVQEFPPAGPLATVRYGETQAANNTVTVTLIFSDPIQGPQAFAQWVQAQQCTLTSLGLQDSDEDDDD